MICIFDALLRGLTCHGKGKPMSEFKTVPLTFQVHPLISDVVKPLIEKLIQTDSDGVAYRALIGHWLQCKVPPHHSYVGDIFRLDMINPIICDSGEMVFSAAHLSSEAYCLQLGLEHATAMGKKLRLLVDNVVGSYAGNNRLYEGR
jgi:hypothetical protein